MVEKIKWISEMVSFFKSILFALNRTLLLILLAYSNFFAFHHATSILCASNLWTLVFPFGSLCVHKMNITNIFVDSRPNKFQCLSIGWQTNKNRRKEISDEDGEKTRERCAIWEREEATEPGKTVGMGRGRKSEAERGRGREKREIQRERASKKERGANSKWSEWRRGEAWERCVYSLALLIFRSLRIYQLL